MIVILIQIITARLKPRDTFLNSIFNWLKSIFHDFDYLQYQNSYNPEAAEKYDNDIELK